MNFISTIRHISRPSGISLSKRLHRPLVRPRLSFINHQGPRHMSQRSDQDADPSAAQRYTELIDRITLYDPARNSESRLKMYFVILYDAYAHDRKEWYMLKPVFRLDRALRGQLNIDAHQSNSRWNDKHRRICHEVFREAAFLNIAVYFWLLLLIPFFSVSHFQARVLGYPRPLSSTGLFGDGAELNRQKKVPWEHYRGFNKPVSKE